ncbi:MAG: hypothetical protein ACFB9N_01755 [Geitlerinemataceae cyanobacterium]
MQSLNILQKLALTTGAIAAIAAAPATAATVTYDFDVAIDSGELDGQAFSGSFSFDDEVLTGTDEEFIAVDALSFDFLSLEYTEADGFPEVVFFDGDFLGLEFSADDFAFTAGFFDLSEAFFSYDGEVASGTGDVVFALREDEEPTSTPEPAGLLAIGAAGIAIARRRR